jgi:hypothetical protein
MKNVKLFVALIISLGLTGCATRSPGVILASKALDDDYKQSIRPLAEKGIQYELDHKTIQPGEDAVLKKTLDKHQELLTKLQEVK